MAVGLPFGPEEQRRRIMSGVKALRQVVQVGDEDDPDARLGQRAEDLAGDLGALALVSGRERLVAQQQAASSNWPAMALIRSSSSSSFPFSIVASSSRLKCVKIPMQVLAVNESAATNIPACIISCARPRCAGTSTCRPGSRR